jgi:ABC-2 type transport system permease protein
MERKQSIEPMSLAVIDRENSTITKMLIDNFKEDKSFSDFIHISVLSEKEAEERFHRGELTGILELPEGFSKSIYYCDNYPVNLTINGNSYLKMQILENIMKSYSKFISAVESSVYGFNYYIDLLNITDKEKDNLNDKISINLVGTSLSRGKLFKLNKIEDIPSSTSTEYFLISLIIIFLMYIGLSAGNFIMSERKNKSLKRLRTTCVNKFTIIISKLIAFFIFCLIFVFAFSIPIIVFKDIYLGTALSGILIFLCSSIIFVISFSIFLGSFFKCEEELMLFGNMFIFISALIGGSFIPIYMMPTIIQNVSKITPNYWITKGCLYLMNFHSLKEIWTIPVILTVFSLAFLIISTFTIERCIE